MIYTGETQKPRSSLKLRDTRRAAAMAGVYTRAVGCLRMVLPTAVVVILAALVLWPMFGAKQIETLVEKSVPNLVIENLKMTGLNAKNEPYKLTASRALQVPDAKGVIDLDNPQGQLALTGGFTLEGQALRGRYDQLGKNLWLEGDVSLQHTNGLSFQTSEASVDLNKNNATGDKPVVINGNFGQISGQGFRMQQGGRVLVVTGKSKALLHTASATPHQNTKGPE